MSVYVFLTNKKWGQKTKEGSYGIQREILQRMDLNEILLYYLLGQISCESSKSEIL